ncbi:hypothetical protein [Actinokineospora enzanensis]|uniref:hypothetical protein n=1 Tax=Actinokineospora enzanensis TaxID=155975 RepID=UPI000363E670|nr:hypothetical protein [Actinokineospora enzanensis]
MSSTPTETIASFAHEGITYELDHLGIAQPEQWGQVAIYADGDMVGEVVVEFPAASHAETKYPALPDAAVLAELACHELAIDAGAPDQMTLRLDNRPVMAAWCGGHAPDDPGSDVLLVDVPDAGRAVIVLGQTVERTETGFRKVDARTAI